VYVTKNKYFMHNVQDDSVLYNNDVHVRPVIIMENTSMAASFN